MTYKLRIDATRHKFLAKLRRLLDPVRILRYPQSAIVAAGFLGILYLSLSVTVLRKPDSPLGTVYHAPERVAPEPLRHRSRKVYPYSVVPGGIYDKAEVRDRMKADPVVYAHYQDVEPEKLIPIQLATPRRAYVSYRRGDRIYWTRRPVKIAAGETVWTDGKSKIRARCGNLLAENPQLPTYWMDPQERKLNEPDPRLLILPARAALSPVPSAIKGTLPSVDDPANPLFAPIEEVASWFPPAAADGTGAILSGGVGGPGDPGTPGNPPVTPPGPNPPGPNPPGPEPPGPNPPGPNPPGPEPPGPTPPGPNPPGPEPPGPNPPVTPPGPNPPGPNPPGPNPPGPNPPGPNPPGPNPPGPNPPGPNPPGPNPPGPNPPGPNPPGPNPPGPNPPGDDPPTDPPIDPPGPPDPPPDPPPPPPTPVPEPSTYVMIGAGLAGMAYYRKSKAKK